MNATPAPAPAPLPPKNTNAFFIQAVIAFAVALSMLVIAVYYLPVDNWIRAFLGLGIMFLTTSAFTLSKVIRDKEEATHVVSRIDQARLERMLSEHDPYNPAT